MTDTTPETQPQPTSWFRKMGIVGYLKGCKKCTPLPDLFLAVGVLLFLAGPAWALFVDRLRRGPGDVVAGTVAVRR